MNHRIFQKSVSALALATLACGAFAAAPIGARYATDAYPAFDKESDILETKRKEPGFFSWWSGPEMSTPADQLALARRLEAEGDYGDARDEYDALVAEWPSSEEAPKAQEALADMLYAKEKDYIDAFAEYKYLLDFYPSRCDYDAVAKRLYDAACAMHREGKTIVFFRFANTVDVRRAFEGVVLRAPGASFAPAALLKVAELREDEGLPDKAISVYETLRNLHPYSDEAAEALEKEARTRMKLLHAHEYNRVRCQDTIDFLSLAATSTKDPALKANLEKWRMEAVSLVEDEAFASAKFYDSRTRTKRSAMSAYERFLAEYPASSHADEARDRLRELQAELAGKGAK